MLGILFDIKLRWDTSRRTSQDGLKTKTSRPRPHHWSTERCDQTEFAQHNRTMLLTYNTQTRSSQQILSLHRISLTSVCNHMSKLANKNRPTNRVIQNVTSFIGERNTNHKLVFFGIIERKNELLSSRENGRNANGASSYSEAITCKDEQHDLNWQHWKRDIAHTDR